MKIESFFDQELFDKKDTVSLFCQVLYLLVLLYYFLYPAELAY